MDRVPVLKIGDMLLVSIQVDDEQDLVAANARLSRSATLAGSLAAAAAVALYAWTSPSATLRVGAAQVLYKRGMIEAPAGTLQAGDELDAVFSFPDGYSYTSDDGQPLTSRASVVVTAVEPAGEADVFAFAVNRVGRFMFSAGVLGKASGI